MAEYAIRSAGLPADLLKIRAYAIRADGAAAFPLMGPACGESGQPLRERARLAYAIRGAAVSAVHFSSAFMAWRTPRAVFDELHDEFAFTVDGCASDGNMLLPRYWTEVDEPLLRSWDGERVFINPPYGRQIARWMEKAWNEAPHALIVALVPSRTDTAWWHDYVMPASEIRFIRGRLEFEGQAKANPASHNAPFPSCIVVWRSPQSNDTKRPES